MNVVQNNNFKNSHTLAEIHIMLSDVTGLCLCLLFLQAPKRDVFKDRPSHPLVSAKAKRKKSKRLTALSDDEDDDNDTDEYKVSE